MLLDDMVDRLHAACLKHYIYIYTLDKHCIYPDSRLPVEHKGILPFPDKSKAKHFILS